MDAGYILIAVILIVGGGIATLGDRIGTRVGKKRLSLFNLRPKHTAVLVTILTGGLISASTLGILFAADEKLRQGVFELDDLQRDLRRKREQLQTTAQELETTRNQKSQVERELDAAKTEKLTAQQDLQKINEFLKVAIAKQQATQGQLNRTTAQQAKTQAQLQRTQSELSQVGTQYEQAQVELKKVSQQRKQLLAGIEQLKNERQRLFNEAKRAIEQANTAIKTRDQAISERDQKIVQLDQLIQKRNLEITAREQEIAIRESRLKELETQQNYLQQEVARLEESYRDLRVGKLALIRGQIIGGGLVRVQKPSAARQVVLQLLQQANLNARNKLTEPGTNRANAQILQLNDEHVEQLIEQLTKQIDDGRQYVVRIFSAGNYVKGEKQIQVFADATLNQIIFASGEVVAGTPANPKTMTSYQLGQQLEWLISASQFRARNAGILDSIQVGDGRIQTLIRFVEQLRRYDQPVDIKVIAAEDIYTAGPLKVRLVAMQNGKVIFST